MTSAPGHLLADRLERFLSHGTSRLPREDVLLIRRVRGFGLMGLAIVLLVGLVASFTLDPLPVAAGTAGLLASISLTTGLSFVQGARWTRLYAHAGIGAMLAGIFATSIHTGRAADISATFPIVLILVSCYVLGVRAAAGWTLVAIIALGVELARVPAAPLAAAPDASSRAGLFAIRSIVFVGVMALAAVERRFADRKSAQLEFLARHDDLTGLWNRRAFEERAEEAIARASRHERALALLVIDLDAFKAVNDAHGHAAGDQVLRIIGQRIASRTRATDSSCRMGGDEFLVLLEDVSEEKDVVLYAERLIEAIRAPVRIGRATLDVGASVGVALASTPDTDCDALTRAADLAMFAAKKQGGSRVHVFDAAGEPREG